MGGAAVGIGDDFDDGEAQAGTGAWAARITPAEGVERMIDELGRKPRTLVANVELDAAITAVGLQEDAAATMPEGVLDEVSERLLGPKAVHRELKVVVRVDLKGLVSADSPAGIPLPEIGQQPGGG